MNRTVAHPVPPAILAGHALPSLREAREAFDRAYLEEALRRAGGNVTSAAKLAGRNRTDFHDLLRRRRRNDASIASACITDHHPVGMFCLNLFILRLRIE